MLMRFFWGTLVLLSAVPLMMGQGCLPSQPSGEDNSQGDVSNNGTTSIQVSGPVFDPDSGVFVGHADVAIVSATDGATVRYTTDSTIPSSSTGAIYSGPLHLTTTTTIKAIAIKTGALDSDVAVASFTITPAGTWSSLGAGMNDRVAALAVYNGELIAGGDFTTADGINANHVARWDGNRWMPLGLGVADSKALTVYGGHLISGGFTDGAYWTPAQVVRWDETQWLTLGTGMTGSDQFFNRVLALCVYDDDLVAAGGFYYASGVSADNIAIWNGASWSSMGVGLSSPAGSLVVYNGQLVAGGMFGVSRWNGTQWSSVGGGMNDAVYALAVYNGRLVAGGDFTSAGGVNASRIAQWNGTTWLPLGDGMGGELKSVFALATYNGRLIAGGRFGTAGGISANRIAQWDGTQWSPLGYGLAVEGFEHVYDYVGTLAIYNGQLIAGGYFRTTGGSTLYHIAYWSPP